MECLTCSHMSLASRTPASVLTFSPTSTPLRTAMAVPVPTSNSQHAVGPSVRPTVPKYVQYLPKQEPHPLSAWNMTM